MWLLRKGSADAEGGLRSMLRAFHVLYELLWLPNVPRRHVHPRQHTIKNAYSTPLLQMFLISSVILLSDWSDASAIISLK